MWQVLASEHSGGARCVGALHHFALLWLASSLYLSCIPAALHYASVDNVEGSFEMDQPVCALVLPHLVSAYGSVVQHAAAAAAGAGCVIAM
jgi:hypothetical protein